MYGTFYFVESKEPPMYKKWHKSIFAASIALVLVLFLAVPPAYAYDPADLEQLLSTRICPGCDLSGADLSDTELSGAQMQEANLQEALFNRATWQGANLQGANLQGSVGSEANLQGARIQEANLTAALLEYANLHKVYLQEAKLERADRKNGSQASPF
ncbi:pentapeptide repeat-containing protein [Okeania sp. KiyG1]|uniref:pentapeptide repeat-containing protein n=1 Tax=Okeania sp. KiyG1 TaxID=2720165 RepID=UPI001F3E5A67|nr:pentapeptide repeat-containing protein [Okeania sp. KiyG1]